MKDNAGGPPDDHYDFATTTTLRSSKVDKKVLDDDDSNGDGAGFVRDALFQVAGVVVSHIHDYPTLICLAMTCRTFHDLIHRSQTTLPRAFDRLEYFRNDDGEVIEDDVTCDGAPASYIAFCDHNELVGGGVYIPKHLIRERTVQQIPSGLYIGNCDLLRHQTCQLPTLEWLPCYHCKRIKRARTHFFQHETYSCRGLFSCKPFERRCVDCDIAKSSLFPDRLRYVQDMPRGYKGYRLRCAGCRRVERIWRKPKGKQASKNLCRACYKDVLAKEGPQEIFYAEWARLMTIQVVEVPRERSAAVQAKVRIVGEDLLEMADPGIDCKTLHRFEVLDIYG